MSETGDRLRDLFTEIAPPIDVEGIVQATGVPIDARRGWLVALAAAAVVLVVGMGSFLLFGESDRPTDTADGPPTTVTTPQEASAPSTSVESTTTVPESGFVPPVVRPVRIDCTSELAAFPCSALVDADETTHWNAVEGGVGAEIVLFFEQPVQITSIDLLNVGDPEGFARNARIRGLEIVFDDVPQATVVELNDTYAQSVRVETLRTSIVVFRVTSAYPGETYEGKEPFLELALAEIHVWGEVAPGVNPLDGQQLPPAVDSSSVDRPALEAAALYVGRVDSQVRLIRWMVTSINDQWESRQITFNDAIENLTLLAGGEFSDAWVTPPQDLLAVLPDELGEELLGVGAALGLQGTVGGVVEGFRAPDDGTMRRAAVDLFEGVSASFLIWTEMLQADIQLEIDSVGTPGERPAGEITHFVLDIDGWHTVAVWQSTDASGSQLIMEAEDAATFTIRTGATAEEVAASSNMLQTGGQVTGDEMVDERVAGSIWVLGSEALVYSPDPTIHFLSWDDPEIGLVAVTLRGGTLLYLTRLLDYLRPVGDTEWQTMLSRYPSHGPVTATTLPTATP